MPGSIASAYVQIIPTTEGITSNLENELGGAGASAGGSAGSKFATLFKRAITVAGIGKALKETLTEGAALQQSIGGIETLFKDSFDTVKKYADDAYKTAGLSANAYMETATSFAASLLQGLGGDTAKAAEITDMAITDMSDNINKMGSSMESIQDAYKGFAKQNYTMLDNLKLGYGGTQAEMERLLADAEELSGIEYDISNLSDVYSAIHVIQEELGITGTTASEAADTLSGSFDSVKAAAENVLGNLALGEDITPSLQALLGTVETFAVDNLTPALINIVTGIGAAAADAVRSGIEAAKGPITDFLTEAQTSISAWATENETALTLTAIGLGALTAAILAYNAGAIAAAVSSGAETAALLAMCAADYVVAAAKAVATAATTAFGIALNFLTSPITLVIAAIGLLVAGIYLLITNWDTVKEVASNVWAKIVAVWGQISGWFRSHVVDPIRNFASDMLAAGTEFVASLKNGISQKVSDVQNAAKTIGRNVVDGIKGFVGQMVAAGRNLFLGLAEGIGNAVGAVIAKAKAAASKVVGAVKGFFGIASPSRLFRDEIGRYLMLGLADGIEDNTKPVKTAIDSIAAMTAGGFESELAINTALGKSVDAGTTGGLQTLIALVAELSKKIDELEIRLDSGELVGGLIQKTDAALGSRDILTERGVC